MDTRTDRTAVVLDVLSGRLYLRKPGGGVEWEAMPAQVRPATEREVLSARVAEANLRSRVGGCGVTRGPAHMRRSGSCYDDNYPELHALCSGRFSIREGPNSSPDERVCRCPCHSPEGAQLRAQADGC
jgi:hypothetical protein